MAPQAQTYTVTRKAIPAVGWHQKARPARTKVFEAEEAARVEFVGLVMHEGDAEFSGPDGKVIEHAHTKGGLVAVLLKSANTDPAHKNKFWFEIEVWSAGYREVHASFKSLRFAAAKLSNIHAGLCMAERAIAAASAAKVAA